MGDFLLERGNERPLGQENDGKTRGCRLLVPLFNLNCSLHFGWFIATGVNSRQLTGRERERKKGK